MSRQRVVFLVALLLILALAVSSCALVRPGVRPTFQNASPSELTGNYMVILYGNRYLDDIETIAILYPENGPYTFEPYAPDFDYRVLRHVPADEAIAIAQRFVSENNAFWRSQLSRIIGPKGNIIGYELRPLYHITRYGYTDVLNVDYRIVGDKVIVYIQLDPRVERVLRRDGGVTPDNGL